MFPKLFKPMKMCHCTQGNSAFHFIPVRFNFQEMMMRQRARKEEAESD